MQAKELDSLMAVVSMGGVGAAAAAAAAWPPSASQQSTAVTPREAAANGGTAAASTVTSRPSMDLSRPIQMNIPHGGCVEAWGPLPS